MKRKKDKRKDLFFLLIPDNQQAGKPLRFGFLPSIPANKREKHVTYNSVANFG